MKPLTVTQARPIMGRLVERAHRGKRVVIRRGGKLVELVPVKPAGPPPTLTGAEIDRINGAEESFGSGG